MAFVSVEQASILTGKSIPTIYRNISNGKVSRSSEGIEISELIRAYGPLKNISDTTFNQETLSSNDNIELSVLKRENELLKGNLEELKVDKQMLIEDKKNLQETIDFFQRQLNAPVLEAEKPVPIPVPVAPSNPVTKGPPAPFLEGYQRNFNRVEETFIKRLFRKIVG